MRGVLIVFAVVLATLAGEAVDVSATSGCHPTTTQTILRPNLDRDRALETVDATNVSCAHEMVFSVTDTCRGRSRTFRLAGYGQREEARVEEANRLPDGRELFYVLHASPSKGIQHSAVAVMHLAPARRGSCPRPKYLFLFRPDRQLRDFQADLAEFDLRYPGRELRLREVYETGRRYRWYRYHRGTGTYVGYRR